MQFNQLCFPVPKISYSSKIFQQELVYVPRLSDHKTRIPCLYLPVHPPTKILMFFHGNAEDVGYSYGMLCQMRNSLNMSIFAMEYQGYGIYEGQVDSDQILEDSMSCYDFLTQDLKIRQGDIVLMGRSIGCSLATHIASTRTPSAVLLVSPFKSIKDVAEVLVGYWMSHLIAQRLVNIEVIKKMRSPLLIIHGKLDTLIPYQHSEQLIEAAQKSIYKELHIPEDMDHNKFDLTDDLVFPVIKFFNKLKIDVTNTRTSDKSKFKLPSEFYKQPSRIQVYEKKLIDESEFLQAQIARYNELLKEIMAEQQSEDTDESTNLSSMGKAHSSPCIKTDDISQSSKIRVVNTPIKSKDINLDMELDENSQ